MMKKMLAVLLALVLVLSFAACSTGGDTSSAGSDKPSSSDGSSGSSGDKITVGVTFMTLNSPFFEAMQRGVKEEAEKAGVEVVISDAQLNAAQQISSVENLICLLYTSDAADE